MEFLKVLNIQQSIMSPYHHQSNGQVEACIKFVQHTMQEMYLILIKILL